MEDWMIHNTFRQICQKFGIESTLTIENSSVKNAYTDGKNVTITTGLLAVLSDNQVIAVLGHEIGHIVLNHIVKLKNDYQNLIQKIGSTVTKDMNLIESILAYTIVHSGVHAATQKRRRLQEFQADWIGELTARSLLGESGAMANVLNAIASDHTEDHIFKTHPATPKRIDVLNTKKSIKIRIRKR
jgi:Zn-dependent protease with chaperone function